MATAREEVVNEPHDALRGLTTPPPGERPALLVEVQPQGCVERHIVEDPSELAPTVQILDAPVPQMVDSAMDFFPSLGPAGCRAGYRRAHDLLVVILSFSRGSV